MERIRGGRFASALKKTALALVDVFLLLTVWRGYVVSNATALFILAALIFIWIIRKYALKKKFNVLGWVALIYTLLELPVAVAGFFFLPVHFAVLAVLTAASCLFLRIRFRVSLFTSIFAAMVIWVLLGLASILAFRETGFSGACDSEEEPGGAGESYKIGPDIEHPYDSFPTPDGKYLFVTYGRTGWIGRIPLTNDGEFKIVKTGTSPQRIAFSPGTGKLFFPLWGRDQIAVIDAEKFDTDRHYTLPGCGNAMDAAVLDQMGIVLVVCEVSNNLYVLDRDKLGVKANIPLRGGMDNYAVGIDPQRKKAFITDWMGPFLQIVDLDSLKPVGRRWIGFNSFGVAVDSGRGMVFVARPLLSKITVLDAGGLNIIGELRAGRGVRDLDIDAEHGILFAGNYVQGTIDIIDYVGNRDSSARRLKAGALLRGITFDPSTRRLFAACKCGIRVFDLGKILPEVYSITQPAK